jgi:hypothetical protein
VKIPYLSDALLFHRLHGRKEDDVPDARRVGKQHNQPVDTDADAARRWHAVFERGAEVLVDHHGLVVALGALLRLLDEPPALVNGIVEFGERVGELVPAMNKLNRSVRYGAEGLRLLSGESPPDSR